MAEGGHRGTEAMGRAQLEGEEKGKVKGVGQIRGAGRGGRARQGTEIPWGQAKSKGMAQGESKLVRTACRFPRPYQTVRMPMLWRWQGAGQMGEAGGDAEARVG